MEFHGLRHFFSGKAMFSLIPALMISGGNPIFIDQFHQA